ncbi:MAG: cytochrome P450 [Actinobacteria bacterium]|nr:cytochrome P450 [Actinomycetota bacterium]
MTEGSLRAEFLQASATERHAAYDELRPRAAVHRLTLLSGKPGYLVTGFAEARQALVDRRLEPRTATVGYRRDFSSDLHKGMNSHMLSVGPQDHARLRRLVSVAFTRRRMAAMRPRIQAITDGLLDAIADRDSADLIQDLALPLPIRVLIEMFGIPEEDADDFHAWTEVITASGQPLEQLNDAASDMLGYVRQLLDRKRRAPQDDLLSTLAAVGEGPDGLSGYELTSMVFLLLTAGHETTVNLIGNGLLSLLSNPDELAAVRADRELLGAVVEETLRFESPVQIAIRFSLEPLEIDGVPIPAGATILVSLLAANRDPSQFDQADGFCPARKDNQHLGFGYGGHFCIGAPLARLEGQVAIGSVLDRFPDLRLSTAPAELGWRPSAVMHGLNALPVRLRPALETADV